MKLKYKSKNEVLLSFWSSADTLFIITMTLYVRFVTTYSCVTMKNGSN